MAAHSCESRRCLRRRTTHHTGDVCFAVSRHRRVAGDSSRTLTGANSSAQAWQRRAPLGAIPAGLRPHRPTSACASVSRHQDSRHAGCLESLCRELSRVALAADSSALGRVRRSHTGLHGAAGVAGSGRRGSGRLLASLSAAQSLGTSL